MRSRPRSQSPSPPSAAPSVGARLAAESHEGAIRERFVRDLLVHVPLARIVELHLFAPMRQGGVESGVAVVAATPEVPTVDSGTPAADPAPDATSVADADLDTTFDAELDPELGPKIDPATDAEFDTNRTHVAVDAPVRHTVYTARYRLTLRGPDRGRWQVDVREEADAPLVTVDAVVRGVQRRAGEAGEAARLDAAAVARLAAAEPAPRP